MTDHVERHAELLPLDQIYILGGFNCREVKDTDEHVLALRDSIRSIGLQEPLQVGVFPDSKPHTYQIVDGENRLRALRLAGAKEALCIIDTFESRDEAFLVNVAKNFRKKRLRTYELAHAASRLRKAGFTAKRISVEIGVSETHVGNLARCVEKLIPPLLDMFRRNDADATVAELIQCAAMSPTEQAVRHQHIVYGRSLEGLAPNQERKPKTANGAPPRPLKRDKIKALSLDVINGESVEVRGKPKAITEDMREFGAVLLRYVLGELKKNPVTAAPIKDEE